jgi:hypothetical protein
MGKGREGQKANGRGKERQRARVGKTGFQLYVLTFAFFLSGDLG